MKNTTSQKSLVMALVCSVLGHDYIITNKITNHIQEYKCTCCGREVVNTYKGFLIDLTSKQRELNNTLYSYVERRRSRVAKQLTA